MENKPINPPQEFRDWYMKYISEDENIPALKAILHTFEILQNNPQWLRPDFFKNGMTDEEILSNFPSYTNNGIKMVSFSDALLAMDIYAIWKNKWLTEENRSANYTLNEVYKILKGNG